jgi:N-formylmaleamate deformylase
MLRYTEGDLKINGVKIHYYRTGGQKPPFVMIHGATDNGLCWSPVAEYFSDRYDVIMPDAQGHGKSDRVTKDCNNKAQAVQIAEMIKQLKLNKPLIMGHSMGGVISSHLAANFPDLPRAVILEDPAWQPAAPVETPEARQAREAGMRANTAYVGKSHSEVKEQGHLLHPKWSEAELVPWAQSKIEVDPNLFDYLMPNLTEYRELVPKFNCPALLITADAGVVTPTVAMEAEELWKSSYPYKWVRIMNSGHSIRREQFEVFKAIVNSYISELP